MRLIAAAMTETDEMIADPFPDWLDREAWQAFKEMRKAKGKRAPFTDAAEKRMLWKLDMARVTGQDTAAMLWQSVVAGWSDVYPVKHQMASGTVESMEVAQTRKLLAEQDAHLKAQNDESKVRAAIEAMARIRQTIREKA